MSAYEIGQNVKATANCPVCKGQKPFFVPRHPKRWWNVRGIYVIPTTIICPECYGRGVVTKTDGGLGCQHKQ